MDIQYVYILADLFLQLDHIIKVGMVDVCIHTKQPLQYGFGNSHKVTRKGSSWEGNDNGVGKEIVTGGGEGRNVHV